MRSVERSNVMLLHMYSPIQYNRHILPILLPQRWINNIIAISLSLALTLIVHFHLCSEAILSSDLECIALSQDVNGGLQKIHLEKSIMGECPAYHLCFRGRPPANKNLQCNDFLSANYGAVVCTIQSQPTSFFPVSLFEISKGLCAFDDVVALQSMENIYSNIRQIRGTYVKYDSILPQLRIRFFFPFIRLAILRLLGRTSTV